MSSTPIQLAPPRNRKREAAIRAGVQIELVTIGWMVVEAIVAIGAGILAHSVLLLAFGIDSVIELITGGTLLWRLSTEARGGTLLRVEQAENRAAWITGVGLIALCLYVVATSALSLLGHNHPDESIPGIVLAIAALGIMPILVWRKRSIAEQLNSSALRADAACSLTCAYMVATLLVGLALTTLFHWWWTDAVGALALLYWLVTEAREAIEGARAGRGGCGCGDDHCSA